MTISPCFVCVWSPPINAWWAQVTVAPEDTRMIVFKRGTPNGLKGKTPIGGHTLPTSILGESLAWKYAQKKLKKKKTSEVINNIIPQRNPNSTTAVCSP